MVGPTGSPASLDAAVGAALGGAAGGRAIAPAVDRLMAVYRAGAPPTAPALSSDRDVAAYAVYRMPATAAAAAAALGQTRRSLPGWAPASVVDLGAGTGGTAWAVAGQLPTVTSLTLLEQAGAALAMGREVLARSGSEPLRRARWQQWQLPGADRPAAAPLPAADLVTAGYVLAELTSDQQTALVSLAAAAAPVVVLVEPGTPSGHRRVLTARDQLIRAGFTVVAPCPHQVRCPLDVPGDWCHFATRLQRSASHRRAKGAELSWEDEKFSFVAAARLPAVDLPGSRVIRRPRQRKGLVVLDLCVEDGTHQRQAVGKRYGPTYREARKLSWGDRWEAPPPPARSGASGSAGDGDETAGD
jgi:ribosomal protein RSM22 (predicted rRNA methylase)